MQQRKQQEQRRQLHLEQQRQKHNAEIDKIQKLIASMKVSLADKEKELDSLLEADTKKDQKSIDDAIAYDLDKFEQEEKLRKAKDDAEKKEQEEKKQQLEAKNKAIAEKEALRKAQEKKLASNMGAASTAGLEEYNRHMEAINNFKKNIKPKLQDPTFRKQCFEARRLIKRSITQIQYRSNVIIEKYEQIRDHILSIKNQSQDAFHVLLNHVGKSLLLQVRQEVNGAPFSAYFLAKLAVLLAGAIPEFKDYLYGRLLKRCPYLVPNYFDFDPSLSSDQIKTLLHYEKVVDSTSFQPFLQHAGLQKCYVMFFAAMITTVTGNGYPANPFNTGLGWTWCARIMNMSQREITPFLIHGFLEIAGHQMIQVYPRQFPKMMRLLYDKVLPTVPIMPEKDNAGVIATLKSYLEEYFQTGKMVPIPEVMPAKV
ncbi:GLE1-like protein-domain-containing protein [Chlamydoabsidia padenii]|nr:GLE1-like protein-domain-containing protein [Chlamydoabsidia padenii]